MHHKLSADCRGESQLVPHVCQEASILSGKQRGPRGHWEGGMVGRCSQPQGLTFPAQSAHGSSRQHFQPAPRPPSSSVPAQASSSAPWTCSPTRAESGSPAGKANRGLIRLWVGMPASVPDPPGLGEVGWGVGKGEAGETREAPALAPKAPGLCSGGPVSPFHGGQDGDSARGAPGRPSTTGGCRRR